MNTKHSPMDNTTVILKRTFNQSDFNGGFIKYWRVIGPQTHRRLNSDLSVEGLKDANVIPSKGDKRRIMSYSPTNY